MFYLRCRQSEIIAPPVDHLCSWHQWQIYRQCLGNQCKSLERCDHVTIGAVNTSAVVNLPDVVCTCGALWVANIFANFRKNLNVAIGISRGPGLDYSWKKTWSQQSRDTVPTFKKRLKDVTFVIHFFSSRSFKTHAKAQFNDVNFVSEFT
jgi:hypothetical protein